MKPKFIEPQVNTVGLIGHWKLYEGTVFDYSLNGRAGTLTGTLPTYRFPGVDLPGTDEYIKVDDDTAFSPILTPFTISAWVKADVAANFMIASKGVINTKGEWWFYFGAGAQQSVVFIDETGNPPIADCYIGRFDSNAISADIWYHVAVTYSGGTTSAAVKLYRGGVQVDDSNLQNNQGNFESVRNDTADVYIGRYDSSYANGKIDDPMIFNTEKSAAEIKSIYEVTRGRYGA